MQPILEGNHTKMYSCFNKHLFSVPFEVCIECGLPLASCVARASYTPKENPNWLQKFFDPVDLIWVFTRWIAGAPKEV